MPAVHSQNMSPEKMFSVECSVCFTILKAPCQLSCGHTMCKECIKTMSDQALTNDIGRRGDFLRGLGGAADLFNQGATGGTRIKCPECRAETIVPRGGLPINFKLQEIVQSMMDREMNKKALAKCKICTEKLIGGINFDCISCGEDGKQLCSTCAIRNHNGHNVVEHKTICEEDLTNMRNQISQDTCQSISKMEEMRDSPTTKNTIDEVANVLETAIKMFANLGNTDNISNEEISSDFIKNRLEMSNKLKIDIENVYNAASRKVAELKIEMDKQLQTFKSNWKIPEPEPQTSAAPPANAPENDLLNNFDQVNNLIARQRRRHRGRRVDLVRPLRNAFDAYNIGPNFDDMADQFFGIEMELGVDDLNGEPRWRDFVMNPIGLHRGYGAPGMEVGQAPAAPGQAPAALGQAPAALGQAPAALDQALAALGQAPAALGQAPAALGQAPAALGQAPAAPGQAPAAPGQATAAPGQASAVLVQVPDVVGQAQAAPELAPAAPEQAPAAPRRAHIAPDDLLQYAAIPRMIGRGIMERFAQNQLINEMQARNPLPQQLARQQERLRQRRNLQLAVEANLLQNQFHRVLPAQAPAQAQAQAQVPVHAPAPAPMSPAMSATAAERSTLCRSPPKIPHHSIRSEELNDPRLVVSPPATEQHQPLPDVAQLEISRRRPASPNEGKSKKRRATQSLPSGDAAASSSTSSTQPERADEQPAGDIELD